MASVSRTTQFANVFRILKRRYKAVRSDPERPVLEHLLAACCLEDCHYEPAEEAYATLKHAFFDFNEIRVTSIAELSEVMAVLPDPRTAANRLKRVLQSIFEETYEFDLEEYRKKNLGPTVKWLEKLDGTTKFSVGYVVQAALGGHSIPIDSGTLKVLQICDLVADKDFEASVVPGLERAIAKVKGVEFGSMLHQLGADFTANPYSPAVREILLSIDPECSDRFPKRRVARKKKTGEGESPKVNAKKDKETDSKSKEAGKKSDTSAQAKKTAAERKKKKTKSGKSAAEEPAAPQKSKPVTAKKKAVAKKDSGEKTSRKSPATKGLSKRKPR